MAEAAARRLIITTMRNEAPFILEWLAYHRLIGFTDFLIFSNDCSDGTDAMLDRLDHLGLITHVPNPRKGKKTVQWQALGRAWNMPVVKKADWILITDVDEFVVINTGAGHLDDLFAARPQAGAFVLSWRMFGSNGLTRFDPAPIMRQFTRAAPEAMIWPWRAVQFKTLFRKSPLIEKLGVHRPKSATTQDWVDDNGDPVGRLGGTLLTSTAPRYGLAQINHYALGSVEGFLVKVDRGKPNHSSEQTGLDYWIDRDLNDVDDRRILRHADATDRSLAELLADPVLAQINRDAIDWRFRRIKRLMLHPDSLYLYSRIRQCGPTRLLAVSDQRVMLRRLLASIAYQKAEADRT